MLGIAFAKRRLDRLASKAKASRYGKQWTIFIKAASQTWIPIVVAFTYAIWENCETSSDKRTVTSFLHAWGGSFFVFLTFVGIWLRAAKQVSDSVDSEQLTGLSADMRQALQTLDWMSQQFRDEAAIEQHAPNGQPIDLDLINNDGPIKRITDELQRSTKGALLIAGIEIERELKVLLWSSGWAVRIRGFANLASAERLVSVGVIPPSLADSVRKFSSIRDPLMHGSKISENDIVRAVDIGIKILHSIMKIPRDINIVERANIPIFRDEKLMDTIPGMTAVILSRTVSGKAPVMHSMFPTSRNDLRAGLRVTSEFADSAVQTAWYLDPIAKVARKAWDQTVEFYGRDIGDI